MYTHIRKQMQLKYGNPISRLQIGGRFPNAEYGSLAYKVQRGIASPEEIKQYQRQIELESENMEDATNWSNDIQTTAESIANNQQVAQDLYEARKNNEIQSLAEDIVKQDQKQHQKEQNYASFAQAMGVNSKYIGDGKGQMSAKGAAITGGISKGVATAVNAIDDLAIGDKNFGSQSQAIDGAVHATSGALLKSGNPYCVCAGTSILMSDGTSKNIEDITLEDSVLGYCDKQLRSENVEVIMSRTKECLEIETEAGNILRCSVDHPIYSAKEGRARYVTVGKKKQRRIKDFQFREAQRLKVGDQVAEIGEVAVFGNKHVKDAYLIGLLIGDGTYGKRKVPRLFTADPDTWRFVESTGLATLNQRFLPGDRYSKEFRAYQFPGYQSVLREHGIYGQTKKEKRLPIDLKDWDKESCAALIAGLIDTDGCVQDHKKQHAGIIFYQSNKKLIKEVKNLLLKFGIHSTIGYFKEKNKYIKGRKVTSKEGFNLTIKRRESVINFYNNITLNISYKQKALINAYLLKSACKGRDTSFEFHRVIADKIKRITPIGVQTVYNLQVSGSHTFIAENIVTHNCMIAGAALEGANFLTKAGGQTVQGYDVDIDNSGYGNLGHMESSSSRDFLTLVGLGGLKTKSVQAKLARRNEQVRTALAAAQISEDQKFESEARMNSVENTIMNNQIALAGGLQTNLLGS